MAGHHFLRIADGGEVIGLVPFNQQVHIGQQQALLVVTQGKAQGIDAPGQGVRETHACWAAFFWWWCFFR